LNNCRINLEPYHHPQCQSPAFCSLIAIVNCLRRPANLVQSLGWLTNCSSAQVCKPRLIIGIVNCLRRPANLVQSLGWLTYCSSAQACKSCSLASSSSYNPKEAIVPLSREFELPVCVTFLPLPLPLPLPLTTQKRPLFPSRGSLNFLFA